MKVAGTSGRDDRQDVWVLKPNRDVDLAAEAREAGLVHQLGGQDFHDDGAPERAILGEEQPAHSTRR